jgi:hypothetical protein
MNQFQWSSATNQIESTVQQLIQQTQQASAQYQQLLKQEQENAALLQQIAQREQQAAQTIQTALQGHHTAVQQLHNIQNLCNQISQSSMTQSSAYLQNQDNAYANTTGYNSYRQ